MKCKKRGERGMKMEFGIWKEGEEEKKVGMKNKILEF